MPRVELSKKELDVLVSAGAYWETELEDRAETEYLKTLDSALRKLARALEKS